MHAIDIVTIADRNKRPTQLLHQKSYKICLGVSRIEIDTEYTSSTFGLKN